MTIPIPEPVGQPIAPQAGPAPSGSINFAELMKASGGANEPLPNGEYDVQIVKAEAKVASTGKTMFAVTMNVVAGPHTNRKLWTNFVIVPDNPNALGMFFANMQALGLDATFFNNQPTPDQVAASLEQKYARVEASQKLYQGTIRNEVKKVKPAVIAGGGIPGIGVPAAVAPVAPAPAVAAPVPVAAAPVAAPVAAAPAPVAAAPVAPAVEPAPVAPAPIQEAPPAPAPVAEAPAPVAAPVAEAPAPVAAPVAAAPVAPAPPAIPF